MTQIEANQALVEKTTAAWMQGTADIFDIVSPEVGWTVVGSGLSGKTYQGLKSFFEGTPSPFKNRCASRMHPEVRGLYAAGDVVVLRWNGAADLVDGQTYRNRYTFIMTMSDGLAVRVEEFCDFPTFEAAKEGEQIPPWEPQE